MPAMAEISVVKTTMHDSKKLIKIQYKSFLIRFAIASIIFQTSVFVFPNDLGSETTKQPSMDTVRKGVVQIRVFSQANDPYSPWLSSNISGSTGTGFLIGKNRILTNAHVVSNAKFIEGQRHNQTEWFQLKTVFVAHDCDLAILEADSSSFYQDSYDFTIGSIPELGSPIDIIGYPIGGSKISISRGIVSRIEQSTYAHSQVDSHLVIQVDAAINPGNSGGPALQNGEVVGVAFQAATKGENIGYIIPTKVIQHFIKDVEDGHYDGYVELGVHVQPSYSNTQRKFKKIPKDLEGVFVTSVIRGGSAEGFLRPGDFLASIDGLSIGKNGTVSYDSESRIDFVEIVDNKFAGEEIKFEVIRDGKEITVTFPAKRMTSMDFMRSKYDEPFPYFVFAGLVFQPMNRDVLESWVRTGQATGNSQFLYRFQYFPEIRETEIEDVVLYRKLSHPINSSLDYFLNMTVDSVNFKKINSLNDLKQELTNSKSKFITIRFKDLNLPLVLNREEVLAANQEIANGYHLVGKE
ncbi:serine protease [Leptospira idonii]|uniref:Serine protease n=2 Tax=Leptospira idonii TaxID=1193500 RepID=A0A4R9LZH6_9LEPT|nr:serine protease [Leptospira idonii]